MQFKHPEILYALLLLIIPIIVHLFQLQRFVKIPFTNVKFLKNIEQQTRKSARLKKWFILLTRMLAFTCLIFAFSQPYFSKHRTTQKLNTTIYLDNSFSMQAKGENGELLKNIAQHIIENNTNPNQKISLLTNNDFFKNSTPENLKNELMSIKYYPHKLELSTLLLQLNSNKSNKTNTLNKSILISDFQNINNKTKIDVTNVNFPIQLLKTTPTKINNIYIDRIYTEATSLEETTLNVVIKSTLKNNLSIPISLFEDTKLIGKTTAKFDNSTSKIVQFNIPKTTKFNGKISLVDNFLTFDNDFFFTLSKPTKINVLSIGKNSAFLRKIYTENEFNFNTSLLPNLNYNNIQKQHLILLNELENIPAELANNLLEFSKKGGSIVIIPSEKSNINRYNYFLNLLQIGNINYKIIQEHKITTINYKHPLLQDVFEKPITNFQYPTTSIYFESTLNSSSNIISFENNSPFISSVDFKNNSVYWVASPLNKNNSNFTQSSLIVPVFYNFAKKSVQLSELYYTISPNTNIDVLTEIGKDAVLKVSNDDSEFIPLQTISNNKIRLDLQDHILKSGFYNITSAGKTLKTIAFNYNRDESNLEYMDLQPLISTNKNITTATSIAAIFSSIHDQQKINWLFKWFLAFSVLFLFIEMLILKYFKI